MNQKSVGVESISSAYSVDGTVSRLKGVIESKGFTLFAHIDHGDGARRAGLQMQPAHVLIFGQATNQNER